jgi:hypothetical protein
MIHCTKPAAAEDATEVFPNHKITKEIPPPLQEIFIKDPGALVGDFAK